RDIPRIARHAMCLPVKGEARPADAGSRPERASRNSPRGVIVTMKSCKHGAVGLLVVTLGLGCLVAMGMFRASAVSGEGPDRTRQAEKGDKPRAGRRMPPAARREEEQAIRKAAQALCEAFNRGDVDALANGWTEDAELTNESGKTYHGRPAIRALLKKSLEESKGSKQA